MLSFIHCNWCESLDNVSFNKTVADISRDNYCTNITNAVTFGSPPVHLPFLRVSDCFISGASRLQNCKKRPISKNVCDGTCPVEYAHLV